MAYTTVLCLATFWLGGVATAQDVIPTFASFVQSYSRSYAADSAEYAQRRVHYEKLSAAADVQNKKVGKLWTAGPNDFWDWSPSEMSSMYGWVSSARPEMSSGGSRLQTIQKADFLQQKVNTSLPTSKSWNYLKSLQSTKNQGGCGSCWAVAAVTLLESATEIHGSQRSFSAQEIVSCVPNPRECGGQGGCRGATVELAVDWVLKNGAFEEFQAPYIGRDTSCNSPGEKALIAHQNQAGSSFGMHGWDTLPENQYEPLMRALAEKGPVAVSADASMWHSYTKGVFDGCQKDSIINHAVVATGYGQNEAGVKFWDIANSWGLSYGEHGHIKVLRKDDDGTNQCGDNRDPAMGTGCKGGPSKVTVCGMCGILYDSVVVHIKK